MKRLTFLILFFSQILNANSGLFIPYLSPGITLSVNSSGMFVLSPKISIGIFNNQSFYNVTFGTSYSSDKGLYPHSFYEIQFGYQIPQISIGGRPLLLGGGFGITNPRDKDYPSSFRFTAFGGSFIFLNTTFLFDQPLKVEPGFQIVLPLPLIRIGNLNG
jgi:hypothetical protein